VIPDLSEKSGCHFETSGATRVLPAPTSGPDDEPELDELSLELLPHAATTIERVSASAMALSSFLVTQFSFI
jgi:hypothetical protein